MDFYEIIDCNSVNKLLIEQRMQIKAEWKYGWMEVAIKFEVHESDIKDNAGVFIVEFWFYMYQVLWQTREYQTWKSLKC